MTASGLSALPHIALRRRPSADATALTVALAAGRSGIGVLVLARPTLLARGLGVDAVTAERTDWLARMFAVRDLALAIGAFDALRREADPRPWLLAAALCDGADAVTMVLAAKQRRLRRLPALATAATAVLAVGTGLAAHGAERPRLIRPSGRPRHCSVWPYRRLLHPGELIAGDFTFRSGDPIP